MSVALETAASKFPEPHFPRWLWLFLTVVGMMVATVWIATATLAKSKLGLEVWLFSISALEVLPFVPLVLSAQLGEYSARSRTLALLYWFFLAACIVIIGMGAATSTMIPAELMSQFLDGELSLKDLRDHIPVGSLNTAVKATAIMILSVIVGLSVFSPSGRELASSMFPIQVTSFTQTCALAISVVLLAACFLPLVMLNKIPQLNVQRMAYDPRIQQLIDADIIRRYLYYRLIWAIPIAILAAGFPITRTFAGAVNRLGLGRLSLSCLVQVIGITFALFAAAMGLHDAIHRIWQHFGWPRTSQESMKEIIDSLKTISGAIAVGIVAGISEELAFRGLLQPRLGLVYSNLLFAGIHAWQYHWDYVVGVFLIGLVCGLVRKWYNTTAAIIVHGVYDTLVVLAATYELIK